MTAIRATIYTETRFQALLGELRLAWKGSRYLKITYSQDKPRSLDQNALSHKWYEQISLELGEDTPEDVKAECKLRFGVPIMRAEDEKFREMYDSAVKNNLTYEQKLLLMRYMPLTSLMSTAQLSRYLQDMQKGYDGRVHLEFPDEAAYAKQVRAA